MRKLVLGWSLMALLCGSAESLWAARESLTGTVMAGYQGWFAAEGDGNDRGWQHYGFGKAGQSHIDLWPDVSGFEPDELFPTPFKRADGSVAKVFSSTHPKTVRRHFEWMRDYGIDGVFLQRFGVALRDAKSRTMVDRVMEQVRISSQATGRTWALMYDLSGLRSGEIGSLVLPDWKRILTELIPSAAPSWQNHAGKPVVAVWGIGFNDGRAYSLDECQAFLQQLRADGMCVMAGVPHGWRTLERDALNDLRLIEVLTNSVDIVSPWSVGRYSNETDARSQISQLQPADAAWCKERGKAYLPVIFPGFSWTNLMRSRGGDAPLNAIPRQKGQFFWAQAASRVQHGADMLYVAMFDEMDEATAIFKCTNDVPAGPMPFATYEGLPSDHYLWLTGQAGRMLRRKIPATAQPPARTP